jgi:hypothetical protein
MSRFLRLAGGAIVVISVLAVVRLLSFTPYTAERDIGAIVRLAWRARGEQVRDCRRLSPEELQQLPLHMRQEEVCEGRLLPYRLVVALDSVSLVDRLVHGAGAREDRPLYVFQDLIVEPGRHRLSVRFTLEAPSAQHEGEQDREDAALPATPPRLALDTTLTLGARRVLLVTYDEERERLVIHGG